jgi:hypothetical protein
MKKANGAVDAVPLFPLLFPTRTVAASNGLGLLPRSSGKRATGKQWDRADVVHCHLALEQSVSRTFGKYTPASLLIAPL